MSDRLQELLTDAKLALDTVENGKSPTFRKAASEWLESIAKSIRVDLAIHGEEVPK